MVGEIASITGGKLTQGSTFPTTHLLLDSRKLIFPGETIFFALNTRHGKGARFISDLFNKGVRNFVVEEAFDHTAYQHCNFILVNNSLEALHLLAAHHRKKFNLPVIGITGSNGKTVIKEWLNQLLATDFNIARSPKSYNSQIGVPLSVLQLNASHTLGIFEAGISEPGEMERLQRMILPTIGVFNNIGEAHNEGFTDTRQKIKEKLKLFTNASYLVTQTDNPDLSEAVLGFANDKREVHSMELFTWGNKKAATLQVISTVKKGNNSLISAIFHGVNMKVTIPFADDASIENAIACWCVLLHLGIAPEIIETRMLLLSPVEMRLQLKHGFNNCSIINDSYSNDLNSLSIALDFLSQQHQHPRRTLVLSDILQSGKNEYQLYEEVATLLLQKKVDRLIAIGPQLVSQQQQFSFIKEHYFFDSMAQFKKDFYSLHFSNETILIKGARSFEFEQIDLMLEQKIHQTILSIDLSAIAHNLRQYRQVLKPGTKTMAMVKAFSYGSGSFEIASLLQFNKVDYLAVAYADEGVQLRKAGITLPVMVMNPQENTFNTLVTYNLEPEIFSFSILFELEKYLQSSSIKFFPVHIKLDSGMHRLGFEQQDMSELALHLNGNELIKVQSVFSHLVASEQESQDDFTRQQANIFVKCCEQLTGALKYDFIRHIANTAAINRHPDLQLDMVRLGIGLYGIDSHNAMQLKLKTVSTLTTNIAQVKLVKAGESVGYGRGHVLEKDVTIATVRIGYADGYPRRLSNGVGKMLVHDQLAPVVGNVCMDMTMIDVTGIEQVHEGDEVVVFGDQLPIQKIAKWANTISYEIMTGISQRVKRVYFEE
ncbi:MAG: bifunctional UDP-N-acetylmuramoyl-tripeptide:D-alanyl-D-alanine ligase/alanine racemase [Ginsengibacter sp.]